MSLLYRRALSALRALDGGSSVPPGAQGALDWTFTLARWLLEQQSGPHPAHRIAASGSPTPFPRPPKDLAPEFLVAGAGTVVGLLRRPQDQNGIVDDAVTLVAPLFDTSTQIASACAIGGFLAALLDGWAMEGAMAQSLFVTRRGEAFGKKKGPSVARALEEAWSSVGAGEGASDEQPSSAGLLDEQAARSIFLIPRAVGLALACRDAGEVLARAGAFGPDAPYVGAVAAMLSAAYAPESLPENLSTEVEERTDLLELLEMLLELRTSRYQTVFAYASRFRRKKC